MARTTAAEPLETALSAAERAAKSARSIVLVEGPSDRAALEALAERQGKDLAAEGISVVPIGGATNIAHFIEVLVPYDVRLAGLCDVAEERFFRFGLERTGVGAATSREQRETLGFFACIDDMEDELIRALGPPAVEAVMDAEGELASYRLFQQQPAQRERTATQQLHRFMGTRSMRKIRYGRLLVEALDMHRVPRPLEAVLAVA
ncbi:hypothetical protein VV02_00395 [Luteipulveratus mongoliensis]|uniref:OLD protein-like TOPRIM domain-containing protein n=2 Tax=Luteipulveratus mongoliensis TaxID=571913 RepID=A0A0K1JP55_9MICO|nr:hypothetical protein VV02_00395 [Luteipulveratus mongoliensis]